MAHQSRGTPSTPDQACAIPAPAAAGNIRTSTRDCAAALREVAGEPGDRLLHWDLHFRNVLGSLRDGRTGDWLAIDPKPLAGDPGFELLPALRNRFAPGDVLRRFDLMTGVLGLERERARAWTLARVLQNTLWAAGSGQPPDPADAFVARTLLAR